MSFRASGSSWYAPAPSTPILAKSAFAQFDYFLDSSPRPAPPIPTSTPTTSLRRAKTVHDPSMTTTLSTLSEDMATIDLSSPRVLSTPSPKASSGTRLPTRRSVQIGEHSGVNWARPLRAVEESSSVRIFGASLQRSRRLHRSNHQDLNTPSPSTSSDEEPVTPPATATSSSTTRSWSLPVLCETETKGLGFGSEVDWAHYDSPLADYFDTASSSTSASSRRASPTPTQSRIISTSDSISELASPMTLDELRHLRQAALDLEAEARVHTPTTWRSRQPSASHTEIKLQHQQRRIKRKAVPSIDLSEIENARPQSVINHPASRTARFLTVLPPNVTIPTSASVSPTTPISTPEVTNTPRPFYQNRLASYSVMEISPRTASLPFTIPPRITSSQSSPSAPFHTGNQRTPSCNGSIVSTSSADSELPITPTSDKEAFVDQMATMKNSIMRFSNMSLVEVGVKKQKKGLSRLFKRASPVA